MSAPQPAPRPAPIPQPVAAPPSAATAPAAPRLRRWGKRLRNALLALFSGAAMALAFPPVDCGNLVWVCLLPLLCLLWLGPAKFWRGFALGWLYGMGMYGTSCWWIHEVGHVFSIPMPLFLGVAFLPLMAVYSALPGLWAGITATLLRPRLEPSPDTRGMDAAQRKAAWARWSRADLLSTLRCAMGCGALWVCIEWLRAHGTLGFSWNSLGMAMYDGLSLVQWAEFVGVSALSFIPVACSVILWGSMRRTCKQFKDSGKGGRPWDFYGAVVVLFALFMGGLALSKAYSPLMMMRRDGVLQLPVAAIQINQGQSERIQSAQDPDPRARHEAGIAQYGMFLRATMAAFDDIQRKTAQKAMQNPGLGISQQLPLWVVWPESAMGFPILRNVGTGKLAPDFPTSSIFFNPDDGLPKVRDLVREMGGRDFVLFTGIDEIRLEPAPGSGAPEPHGMLNSLACIPGGFDSIRTVSKQRLMPFGEYIPLAESFDWINRAYSEMTGTQVGDGIRPGSGNEPLAVPVPGTSETIGAIPAICYEDTVGDALAKFVRKGPQVIVNVTNDGWFRRSACGAQQARAAAFRCIELRRPMVRAANMGVTCAIAPNGAVIDALLKADGTPHLPGYSYAVLPVDRNAGLTLYAMLGDWAVIACALLALAMCAAKWLEPRNAAKQKP